MKLALFTVSYSGIWYDGEELSLIEQIDKAEELGFDGISIEAKRPVAAPFDLTNEDIEEIKAHAEQKDIEICAIESMSNFSSPVMEERENNLAMMKSLIEMTKKFNADILKVFAAWPGVNWQEGEIGVYEDFNHSTGPLSSKDVKKWKRAKKGIAEVTEWAKEYNIDIALQNHPPVLRPGYEDALAMIEEIGKDNLKLCLDVPLFYGKQDDEYIEEAVDACGEHVVLSHYGAWNFEKSESGEIKQKKSSLAGKKINYRKFLKELKEAGFDGYLAQEYCLPAIKNHKIKGIKQVDRASKNAIKYMRQLIDSL